MMVAFILGNGTRQADMLALATMVPNSLYILFAGGALNTVLVPQIVRAIKNDDDGGEAYTNRIVTAFMLIITAVAVVVTIGAPLVDGAKVSATLIETRKGEKVKIFKKIRRQGYRRTRGHRQSETVLRVTAIDGAGKSAKWDGKVDLTSKALLDARARNLKNVVAELEAAAAPAKAEAPAKKAAPKKAAAKKSDDAAE